MRTPTNLLLSCIISGMVSAQNNVGIGITNPDASARLDVSATDKGILIPRISLTNITTALPVVTPATGLLVYNTNASVIGGGGLGFYYWDGAKWLKLIPGNEGWLTNGNLATNPAIHFIGTTDNQPLNFRVNNLPAGRIDNNLHNVFIGIKAGFSTAPSSEFDARYNTFIGDSAGFQNTTGLNNTFIGREAGFSNTTANANSFFGFNAGRSNTTGQPNSFFGYLAGEANTTGNLNAFFGYFAGQGYTTGSENSFFGASAGRGDIINGSTGKQNSAFGRMAGQFLTTGSDNSFFGAHSGNQNTTGSFNSFMGDSAGFNNTTGISNSFFGREAGLNNSTAGANSFFGFRAGRANTTGQPNAFFGYEAGESNTTGNYNSFFGYFAGQGNTTGSENAFFGASAGRGDIINGSTGKQNSAFGRMAGQFLTTGSDNSFFGAHSGNQNTTGSYNTFVGDSAGFNNTTANNNSFVGVQAGASNTTGNFNSFFGAYSGHGNTTGDNNAFFGGSSGYLNTTGGNNSIFGVSAGIFNISGNYNSFFGSNSGYSNSTGSDNSFLGALAGQLNSTGSHNTFAGYAAGNLNSTGSSNSFFGQEAGILSKGSSNSFFGAHAGMSNGTGNLNTFIGDSSGYTNNTGSQNSFLGYAADGATTNLVNATALGARARINCSNCLILGSVNGINGATSSVSVGIGLNTPLRPLHVSGSATPTGIIPHSDAVIVAERTGDNAYISIITDADRASAFLFGNVDNTSDGGIFYNTLGDSYDLRFRTNGNITRMTIDSVGNVGIGTTTPDFQLELSLNSAAKPTSPSWTVPSDLRLKENVYSFNDGLSVLKEISPVWFTYTGEAGLPKQTGVGTIAQELQSIAPYMIKEWNRKDEGGNLQKYLGVDYGPLQFILINSIKEQQLLIEKQQNELSDFRNLISQLMTRVEALEKR